MVNGIIIISVAILLILGSAWLRISRRPKTRLSLEPKDTMISREVKNVVANAGGIYVSFTLAAAFLKLELMEELTLFGVGFDPLAAFALLLALIQPLIWPEVS